MNLAPDDQAEYLRDLAPLEAEKQAAIARNDKAGAKRARQKIGYLHDRYRLREAPPPPPSEWEIEHALTLEQRVDRLERTLKIGRYSDDF